MTPAQREAINDRQQKIPGHAEEGGERARGETGASRLGFV